MKIVPERITKHFSSLRGRLQALVLVAIIPIALLVLAENIHERVRQEAALRGNALSLVNLAKGSLEQHINSTRPVLQTMSFTEVMQNGDPAAITAYLKEMHRHYPEYTNFGVVDLQGNVIASAAAMTKPVNASDLFWFQQTINNRAFTIGEYQIGRITGLEVIVFGQPVFDRTGRPKFLLFAAMDLKWLNRLWENIKLQPDSTFTVTDHNGTILFRYPLGNGFIGKKLAQVQIITTMLTKGSGITEADGLDSKNRIYAFTMTGTPKSLIHLAVGISKEAAFVPLNNTLLLNLIALAMVAALSLLLANLYAWRFIIKTIKVLQDSAEQIAAGDYSSRINLTAGGSEFVVFAKLFDEMAEKIETDTKKLRLYRELIDRTNDAIFLVDPETGRFLDANEQAGINSGYSHAELLSMHVMDMDAIIADKSLWKEHAAQIREKGHVLFETSHRRKDGTTFPVEINISYVAIAGHNYNIGIVRDITEREKEEELLRESHYRMQTILRSSPAAIITMNPEGVVTGWNNTAEQIFGWSAEEAIGKINPIVPEDKLKECQSVLKKVLGGESLCNIETQRQRKDGSRNEVSFSTAPMLDGNGNIIGIIALVLDITGHKKTEELITNILETVDEGFIIIDRDFRIISANRAYANEVKMPLEEILGKPCYEVSHQFSKPCYESAGHPCTVHQVFETGEPASAVHTHYDKAGNPVYVETKAYPLAKDGQGRVLTAIETVTDITEKRNLEGQLRQAHKMEAVGQLAGGIAHDFNNILTTIIGYSTMLTKALGEDDPNHHMAQMVLESGERAASLTRSLLTFSRKQALTITTVDINGLIRKVERLLQRIIGEDIKFTVQPADMDLAVLADASQIEQVLMNLATNARDAMPEGGALTISAEQVNLDKHFLEAHGYGKPGRYALITVADTGTGMAKDIQLKIFDPFFTTKEFGKGTGLGLSIVYGVVKQHDGFINVYSEPGMGTTFRIYLPLTKKEAAEAIPAESTKVVGGSETILVAEDDKAVRTFTKIILERSGYTVIEAVDGEDAVEKFRSQQEEIDLLLFDMVMPKLDGKKAYDLIREIRPTVKALFASGYTQELITERYALPKGVEFIYKPISPTALLKKVREALEKGEG